MNQEREERESKRKAGREEGRWGNCHPKELWWKIISCVNKEAISKMWEKVQLCGESKKKDREDAAAQSDNGDSLHSQGFGQERIINL